MNALDLFLTYPFLQRALLAALLVAALAAVLGVFVVLRGLSMLGDGLAHISFAGFALGAVLSVYPLPLALAFAVAGALAIQLLRDRGIVKSDAAIGILFTSGLALGVILVSFRRGFGVDVQSVLFGNLLGVTGGDIVLVAVLSVALLALVGLLYKEFFYVTFSEEAARLSGVPVGALNVVFIALTAASIVVTARVVGILLVSALLVVPAATGLQFARSFATVLVYAVAFGLASVLVGVLAATQWGLPTGATVALTASLVFVLAVFVKSALAWATRARKAVG